MPFDVISEAAAQPAPSVGAGSPLSNRGVTLEKLVSELSLITGSRSDIKSDRIEDWINEAYLDVCNSLQLDELEASFSLMLVGGENLYMLPERLYSIRHVSLTLTERENFNGGYPLDKVDLSYYRGLADEDGDPRLYVRQDRVLVLWPRPDATRILTIDARFRPEPLTLASHSPIVPREWHEGIKLGARRRAFSALLEFDKAAAAQNEYVAFMRQRADADAAEDENRVIHSSVPGREPAHRNRVKRRGGTP